MVLKHIFGNMENKYCHNMSCHKIILCMIILNVLCTIESCICAKNKRETVKSFTVNFVKFKREFYFVEKDSINSNVCFWFDNHGKEYIMHLDDLLYNLSLASDDVSIDAFATSVMLSGKKIGRKPKTSDLLHLMSLCLNRFAEERDISLLGGIEFSMSDFPELRCDYTMKMRRMPHDTNTGTSCRIIETVEKTRLRSKLDSILQPYNIKIKSIKTPLWQKKLQPTSKEDLLRKYDIDKNVEIPDSVLDVALVIALSGNQK